MDIKKIDFKFIIIIILAIGLIISFFFGQRSQINHHGDKIKELQEQNKSFIRKNDSLILINKQLDVKLLVIAKELDKTNNKIIEAQLQLDKLKNKSNEIHNSVNKLSANDVASGISKYLDKNVKSRNNNK